MTDVPGENPGDTMSSREYEIQLLVPNLLRKGERWRPFGEPYGEFSKAEYAVEDVVGSMAAVIGKVKALEWAGSHVRVMEVVTTVAYGKEIEIALRLGS